MALGALGLPTRSPTCRSCRGGAGQRWAERAPRSRSSPFFGARTSRRREDVPGARRAPRDGSALRSLSVRSQRSDTEATADGTARQRGDADASPRQRSRSIPAAERREVYQRDAGRCTYVDARGGRCCETRYLEPHHLVPFAKPGANVASNPTLRCSAHNALSPKTISVRRSLPDDAIQRGTRHSRRERPEGEAKRETTVGVSKGPLLLSRCLRERLLPAAPQPGKWVAF